jgi:hypothetical protein
LYSFFRVMVRYLIIHNKNNTAAVAVPTEAMVAISAILSPRYIS